MSEVEILIAHYLDDTLTDDQATELQTWLHADAANLRTLALATAREEQLRAVVVSTETLAAATDLHLVPPEREERKPRNRRLLAWSVAASLIAIVAWFLSPQRNGGSTVTLVEASGPIFMRSGDGPTNSLSHGATFTVGTLLVEGDGARAKFSYPDGSTFVLSGASEMTLNAGNGKEWLLRKGALLASVTPRSGENSLVVRTSTVEATVLGTSFAMNTGATGSLLHVSTGSVKFRRLADGQSVTVTRNQQVRAGQIVDTPLRTAPIPVLESHWRAEPSASPETTWLGEWDSLGILTATQQKVFLKKAGVEAAHYHAGARNSFPGLVILGENSVVRIRYRIDRPLNLGLFLSTHAPSWDFTGNFQAYVEERKTPADTEGWRTAAVPIGLFTPMPNVAMKFQPDCVLATFYATTFNEDVGLEVAELEVISNREGK